ncbi:hypothetical protein NDU88_006856 [Pleurodeles waltl]|uniref:Uncharacterized protein n=1 Tax=Pleurodeles waltl TaxID=8319 RepID=A0AAV7TYD5_PLEWA|nr:hypothetical protein NDU88_006856 [Pleurodeles waltl]
MRNSAVPQCRAQVELRTEEDELRDLQYMASLTTIIPRALEMATVCLNTFLTVAAEKVVVKLSWRKYDQGKKAGPLLAA